MSIAQAVLTSLECPVCFDYVLPPIYQCQAGHLVCSVCRPKLKSCPACRGRLGNIRNLAMEKVASTVFFPCKYSSSGCTILLLHNEKKEHEDACEFRPYVCPYPGAACEWQGSLEQVVPHIVKSHKRITKLKGIGNGVFPIKKFNEPGALNWVTMPNCLGHDFIVAVEKSDMKKFFAYVYLIGSEKDAEKFSYTLELKGYGRRSVWESTTRSIREGEGAAILNSDCLVFDTNIAQFFAENGVLGINVTISMKN